MKTCLSWSGGRDSMMMLHTLRDGPQEVEGLLTTFSLADRRMMMHGVPIDLVEKQVQSLGISFYPVFFEEPVSNENYEETMSVAIRQLERDGFTAMGFGDLFLEDIRKYREKQMAQTKLSPIFPLWGRSTSEFAMEFIHKGYKAKIVCVDGDQLDSSFLGRDYDKQFLEDLPDLVDPCGENGEFHSFVYDGPLFKNAVSFDAKGHYIKYNRFHYLDLI